MINTLDNKVDQIKILNAMEENGVIYYSEYEDSPLDMDSMTFISIIVSLENQFEIDISEEFLGKIPKTFQEFMKFASDAVSNARLR